MAARPRVGFVVGVIVAGLVLFLVPSAWLHARGMPYAVCLVAGLLAFPLLPVGWHVWAERKRGVAAASAKPAAKVASKSATSSLSGGDRFTMRFAAVALLALGPLLFFRPGQTWRAVRHDATWFIPTSPPGPRSLAGDPRLLAQVPGDAEVVVWMRALDALQAGAGGDARRDADQPDEALIAFRDGELIMVVRGPDKALSGVDLDDVNRQLDKVPAWMPIKGKFVARRRGKDLLVIVTEGWAASADDRDAGKSTGPTTLTERLNGAPRDAVIIAAAAPSRPISGITVNGAQSWLRVSKNDIRLDGEMFVSDKTAALAIVATLRASQKDLEGKVPSECKQPMSRLLSRIVIDSGETSVRLSARWDPKEIGEAMMCGLAAAMKE